MVTDLCCTAFVIIIIVVVLLVVYLGRRRIARRIRGKKVPQNPSPQQYPVGHCPKCGAPTVWDSSKGQYHCPDCGRVI